ncbi:MAG: hypothetical protein NUV96_00705 [Candidatus Colwellbacteria bacterium]|nr:hypothetical protein [Candidatus Colwellbacteria bacterium]
MNYDLGLNDRPFKAIKDGTKKIEGRFPKSDSDNTYDHMGNGDTLTFTNNTTGEKLVCIVLSVTKYPDVKSMLEAEGTKNVLSSGLDIEGGIQSYNSFEGYEKNIKKFGIYAIAVNPVKS